MHAKPSNPAGGPNSRRSIIVLASGLFVVLALTAMLAESGPESDLSDPLMRDESLIAASNTHDSVASQNLHITAMRAWERGDLRRAKTLLRQALEAQPDNLDVIQSMAQMFYLEGNYERARPLFEACLEAQPDRMEHYASLAIVLLCIEEFEAADAVAVRGLATVKGDDVGPLYLIRARVSDYHGQSEQELEHLAHAREILGKAMPIMVNSRWCSPLKDSAEYQAQIQPGDLEVLPGDAPDYGLDLPGARLSAN